MLSNIAGEMGFGLYLTLLCGLNDGAFVNLNSLTSRRWSLFYERLNEGETRCWSEGCKIAIDYVNGRNSDFVNCILPGPALDPLREVASHPAATALPETPPKPRPSRILATP